ncbi:MAG TPA: hypothetical protein DCQ98_08870 [Planctomycetaceae bacterium]|nr:hypothetical protein [Planctomycetaceae bacterium]HRF00959.1 hypothetical protein [Pirellulaceae bacterium]
MNQRKQELQHNELADWLEVKLELLRPYFGPIVLGVVAVIAAIAGGIWWYQGSLDAKARSWAAHFDAADRATFDGSVEPLARHAAADGDATARSWSRHYAADAKLKEGMAGLYRDRAKASEALEEAAKGFREVMDNTRPGTMIHDHATFGNAVANEALGKVDEALAGYLALAEGTSTSALGKLARRYHDRLASVTDAGSFVERFVQHTPTGLGAGSLDGSGLDPLGTTPGGLRPLPDLSFPESSPLPPGLPPAPGNGELIPDETVPGEASTPAETTPAETTPAETPAGEAPPVGGGEGG